MFGLRHLECRLGVVYPCHYVFRILTRCRFGFACSVSVIPRRQEVTAMQPIQILYINPWQSIHCKASPTGWPAFTSKAGVLCAKPFLHQREKDSKYCPDVRSVRIYYYIKNIFLQSKAYSYNLYLQNLINKQFITIQILQSKIIIISDFSRHIVKCVLERVYIDLLFSRLTLSSGGSPA